MTRSFVRVVVVALAASFPAASCGSDVTAFECSAESKSCLVNGRPACVLRSDPKYGCASEVTCLSCGALGFQHVAAPSCGSQGQCVTLACEDGYMHCEGPESGGCETSVNSTTKHCGACNNQCPTIIANGMPACTMGLCTSSCSAGFFDCDKRIDNGCECQNGCNGTTCAP